MPRSIQAFPDRLRGSVADPIVATWRAQRYILLAYLVWTLYAFITWDSERSPLAFLATTVALAAQWGLTALTFIFINSRIGRFFRARFFVVTVTIVVIVCLAVATAAIFSSAAYTNGWTVIWRITATLIITVLYARLDLLAQTLQREKEEQDLLRSLQAESIDTLTAQRTSAVDQIVELMNDALDSATTSSKGASEQLRGFAQDYLRPLSHEVIRDDPLSRRLAREQTAHTSWRDVANAVSLRPALKPWLMAWAVAIAFWVATAQPVEETSVDVSEATGANLVLAFDSFIVSLAVSCIIFFVTALTSLLLQKLLTRTLPRLRMGARLLLLVAAPVVIAASVEIAIQILYVTPGFSENISSNLFDRLWFAIPIVAIAFIVVAIRAIGEIFANAERRAVQVTSDLSWELSRLQCIYSQEQQFFANQLHGPLQSIAASASLRVANVSPGTREWDSALSEIRSDFTEAVEQLSAGPEGARDVNSEIERLRRTWAGVCDVELCAQDDVLHTLDADWVAAGVVMDICIEAVANAAIHGKAKNVQIEMNWVGDEELQIDVTNDGSTEVSGEPGLGSRTLDRVAISWSRDIVDEGLRLRAVVAVPHR